MPFIETILQQYPEAANWPQQYPWFSLGHLVNAANKKETAEAIPAAQKAALFFDDMVRLHWLLHQPAEKERNNLFPEADAVPEEIAATPPPESTETNTERTSEATSYTPTALPDQIRFSEEMLLAEENTEEEEEELEMEEADKEDPFPVDNNSFLSQSLALAAENFKTEPAPTDELAFDTTHQHTVDYFASQGIKLDTEPAQDDQFGRQLKTFTSWLRQMKRLPDTPASGTDPLVETFAAHSLQQEDVLTEPMADVLLKQGKKEQAIHVLEKLGLLHPQKSHYFASRIEQIKQL